MKRILHVIGCMDRAGTETFIMNCYRQIDRTAIQFDFVVISGEQGAYDAEIESMGGRIYRVARPKLINLAQFMIQLRKVMVEHGPYSAVHSHVYLLSGLVMSAAQWARVPVRIAHSHSTQDGQANSTRRNLYRSSMKFLIRRHATQFLGCSSPACQQLFGPTSLSRYRAQVVRNGIDIPKPVNVESKNAVRQALGLQDSKIVLGHVGRFEYPKNQSFLVDLLQMLSKEEPSASLVLVGDGSQRCDVENQAAHLGLSRSVVFAGIRDDVNRILTAFDVFVFPSFYEGLGLAVIEAQAAGIPCIVSESIPPEVDIGLGLVEKVSLDAGINVWIEAVRRGANRPRVDAATRADALRKSGYAISSVVEILMQVYSDENVGLAPGGLDTAIPVTGR
jgi:glycosyltransferase EpsF